MCVIVHTLFKNCTYMYSIHCIPCFWLFSVEIIKSSWTFCPPPSPPLRLHFLAALSAAQIFVDISISHLSTSHKGYGNLTTKTPLGKIATMLYALIGIPLMYLYMANIGGILASSFKYLYSKLCRFIYP